MRDLLFPKRRVRRSTNHSINDGSSDLNPERAQFSTAA